MRANITTGKNSRESFLSATENTYGEIFYRDEKISQYLSDSSSEYGLEDNLLVFSILGYGTATTGLQIRSILENAPIYFPEISTEEIIELQKKNESLEAKILEKFETKDPQMGEVIELSGEITKIQKMIMEIYQETFFYNERKMANSIEILSYSSSLSTRFVLLGFFITFIIFTRLQWLEYKSQRRITKNE